MRLTVLTFYVAVGLTCSASVHAEESWRFQTGVLRTRTPPTTGRLENGVAVATSIAASNLDAFYVDLKVDNEGVPVRKIWQKEFDEELSARARFSEKTHRPPLSDKLVYAAAFMTPKGRIIVSATSTINADCQSYEEVGLSPKLITCPMKVALVSGGDYKIIYSSERYPFAVTTDANGAPVAGANENTLLTYNIDSKKLTTSLSSAELFASRDTSGYRDPLSNDDTTIDLQY